MSGFERLLELLEARGPVKRQGRNYRALCPAHDDHDPSLDVADAGDGTPLVVCRSHGCTFEAILEALGTTPAALNGDRRDDDAENWTPHGLAVAFHPYHDEAGRELYQVARTADKQFPARRRDPSSRSGWRWNLDGVRRVLLHLPRVREAVAAGEPVYVVEGEKDVGALERLGLVATCNPGGAGNWRDEYADSLAGAKRVVVLGDDDDKGRRHVEEVARSLAGRVDELKVVELYPRGDTKRDVSDWIADQGEDEAAYVLEALVEWTSAYAPADASSPASATEGSSGEGPRPLRTIRGDSIEMRSIEWLDKPLLQGSAFHLVAGPKGVGKGTWLARKIADTTHGQLGPKRNVLIVASEDSATIDLKPRLVAAGADHARWYLVVEELVLPRDLFRLEDLANATGDVGLIVLDPVGNHLGGVDTDKEGLVRFAIGGLNRLADELACMIVGVRHLAKMRVHGALAAVLGSTAWVDVPRAVLAFARDDENELVFHVQVVAGNRSGRTAAHGYRIELRDVGLKEPVTCAVSIGESTKSVDDLLAAPRRESKSADARELILDILETDGEQESDALDARVAAETGLAARTIRNLRGELGRVGLIKSVPESDELFGAVARWKVVRTAAPRPGTTEVPE